MEELLKNLAAYIALIIEGVAVIVVTAGAAQAVKKLCGIMFHMTAPGREFIWREFAIWLILGLEFMLAADILRTVISPTWNQLGQLAVVALIRTFLNYFLERDIAKPLAGS